jgi:hypothetical protein
MLKEEKEKILREKDQLLAEKTAINEVLSRALHSMSGLAREENEVVEVQVMKLVEAIQQLQARVMKLDIQAIPITPQKVHE